MVHEDLYTVLERAWSSPFTTRSEFARLEAEAIAEAACMGYITTSNGSEWTNLWRITSRGLNLLEKNDEKLS